MFKCPTGWVRLRITDWRWWIPKKRLLLKEVYTRIFRGWTLGDGCTSCWKRWITGCWLRSRLKQKSRDWVKSIQIGLTKFSGWHIPRIIAYPFREVTKRPSIMAVFLICRRRGWCPIINTRAWGHPWSWPMISINSCEYILTCVAVCVTIVVLPLRWIRWITRLMRILTSVCMTRKGIMIMTAVRFPSLVPFGTGTGMILISWRIWTITRRNQDTWVIKWVWNLNSRLWKGWCFLPWGHSRTRIIIRWGNWFPVLMPRNGPLGWQVYTRRERLRTIWTTGWFRSRLPVPSSGPSGTSWNLPGDSPVAIITWMLTWDKRFPLRKDTVLPAWFRSGVTCTVWRVTRIWPELRWNLLLPIY